MKSAADLENNPEELTGRSSKPEAPVTTVINYLMTSEGKKLHLLTRNNPNLSDAVQVGLIYRTKFGSKYVAERVETLELLAISHSGQGRDDLNAALQAGGKLPDAYFEKKGGGEFREGL